MPRKPRFRPEIARIRLNPEQAVLACECFGNHGWVWLAGNRKGRFLNLPTYCMEAVKPGVESARTLIDACGSSGSVGYLAVSSGTQT
ncbi:hypothetical protein ACFL1K_01555 [Candidatus Omnitrophota bacterium]